jgi:hypothetical protein
MEFKFGTMSIFELGQMVSSKLREDGITQKSELCVYLNEEEFKKVDEDLFYRTKRGNREDFVPSEGEIDINFEGVKIIVKQKEL